APRAARPIGELRPRSIEIANQRLRRFARHDRLVAVLGMLGAELERCPALDRVLHPGRQLEPDEVHGGSLLVVAALEILVRDPRDAPDAVDLEVEVVLDSRESHEGLAPLLDVRELDHERRFEVAAVRDQRIVRGELLFDRLGLEDSLDTQHLLNLILYRQPILEVERRVRSERDLTVLLVLEDLRAKLIPQLVVLLEAVEIAD